MGQELSPKQIQSIRDAWDAGIRTKLGISRHTGLDRGAVRKYLDRLGLSTDDPNEEAAPMPQRSAIAEIVEEVMRRMGAGTATPALPTVPSPNEKEIDWGVVLASLRKSPMSTDEICERYGATHHRVAQWIEDQTAAGVNLVVMGGRWALVNTVPIAASQSLAPTRYVSRPDNTFCFGAMGDTHLGSKWERLDVMNDLHDVYAQEGVDRVFHTGNWVDGHSRLNQHSLRVHGLESQLSYFAEQYPKRDGLVTYAVTGDDHEGWWTQSQDIDPGKRLEQTMRQKGRQDWVNLGYMEAFVDLVNANTGKTSRLLVAHPGGGSAYALSYSIQKIVESYDGGEKPAVGLYGHYHKLWFGNIRNVFCVQTGCTMDQGAWLRKKRIDNHVGGTLVWLTQDPETGAITRCRVELLRYFNQGYYNRRWEPGDNVVLPERKLGR